MMPGEGTRQMAIIEMLAAGPCLTTAEMVERSGLSRNEVADVCVRLVRRGWVDRLEHGCFTLSVQGRRAHRNGETITSGPAGRLSQAARRPKRRTVRDKMWSTIRLSKKFDLARLEEMAGATNDGARRFVGALIKAGFLVELRRSPGEAPTSNGFKRWLLVDDPGPATPTIKADGRVWDPNRREFREVAR